MKVACVLLLIFLISGSSTARTSATKNITTVDLVISELKDQSWDPDDTPCIHQTLTILNNVRNYTVWAVWIWNSMHHPVGTFHGSQYSLGNYDQCLRAPSMSADPQIVTQYCLAEVKLTRKKYEKSDRSVLGSTEAYLSTKTIIGRDLNKVTWGVCLPSTCSPGSISKVLKTIYSVNPLTPSDPEILVDSCQKAGEETKYRPEFYGFMGLIAALVLLSFYSTYCPHHCNTTGALHNITNAFSLKRNWISLTKKSEGEVGVLNLLKVMLATLAVGTHTAFFEVMAPISNGIHFDELLLETRNPIKNCLKHIDLPVDNFLMISGLLLVKGLMDRKKKPLVSLVNRYFRLAASFGIIIFYMESVHIYTGDGPFWHKFARREQKACVDNWWRGLLMINNYFNSENICLMVSWYIPVDYQLAIMGTIIFMIWQKNQVLGEIVTTITAVLAVVLPGIITYRKKLPGLVLFHDLEQILDFRKNKVFLDTYIRSHNRAGPYFIGMALGYIISIYKPRDFRNVIAKKFSLILLTISSIVAYNIVTAPLSWVSLEYDHIGSALYAVYSRNLWALCTGVTIVIVEYGQFDCVRKFANWHGFTIMSRLTYGIYLTHSVILLQNVYSRKNLQQFDMIYAESLYSFGVLVVSTILATLLWLFIEAPINNIVNLYIDLRSKDRSPDQRTKEE